MSLKFYYHPLASFCQKVLVALYENETPFEPHFVDLGNETARAEYLRLWPIGKMPVLRDDKRNWTVPETSIIIEYLAAHYPGKVDLVLSGDLARQVRFRDRFFDLYVQVPMQKIVGDRIRPAGSKDPYGVEEARTQLKTAIGMVDTEFADKTWAMDNVFTMADCAAAPALAYANMVMPLGDSHKHAARYLDRLMSRPSFLRIWKEAEPYRKNFPQ
jgi:glutathione S-transferase